jgi:cytochrome c oxidase assembly protein subunit 11
VIDMDKEALDKSNKLLIRKLLGIVVGMCLFTAALVPLYDVFCDITGINGKTNDKAALYQANRVDKSRSIKVEFITNISRGMPWEFKSTVNSMTVHPGQLNEVIFYAKNTSRKAIVGQSVPSVSPGEGALYFNKTECFCFDQQRLAAGEEITMPMKFYIDADLPQDITNLTLSYQLFNVTEAAEAATVAAR